METGSRRIPAREKVAEREKVGWLIRDERKRTVVPDIESK